MLLIKATRDALLKPLSVVVGIVERRNTKPILSNVLIRKQGQSVSFTANDSDIQICTQENFGVGEENCETTVAARKFLDILRALPDTAEVSISLVDSRLSIQAGRSRFNLQTLPATDYPSLTVDDQWLASFGASQKSLKNLFGQVHFAMAVQDIRSYLNGLLLAVEPGKLHAVSTDSHRLAHAAIALENQEASAEIIVPRKTIAELQRLLNEDEAGVSVEISAKQIRLQFGNTELISKLIEGKYPDYRRVIPNYDCFFDIPREPLHAALQRIAILTPDKIKGIRLQLSPQTMQLSSSNSEQEDAREELEIDYSFAPVDSAFNVTYLLDVLSNIKTENIRWNLQPGGNSSVLISLPGDDEFKYVVMPMRI